jgi:phthalate 4,5-cis-dihydrodiol dehydrogenase
MAMMGIMLRLGFVGCGEQATNNLLPALKGVPHVQIAAVCDIDSGRLDQTVRRFGINAGYRDYRDLIKTEAVDALVLAGPPQMHVEIADHGLRNGIPVFVEKPPAVTTAELERLAELADKRGVVTGIGHNLRFARPYLVFCELARSEDFGNPKSIHIRFLGNKPKERMWGLDSVVRSFLLAQGIHPVDLTLQWLGTDYDLSVTARAARDGGVLLHCFLQSGALTGIIVMGSMAPSFIFDVSIISDRSKILELDGLWNIAYRGVSNENVPHIPKPRSWRLTSEPSPLDSGYVRSGYHGELEAFVRAITDGAKGPPTFRDELAVYHAIDRIERMAKAQLEQL